MMKRILILCSAFLMLGGLPGFAQEAPPWNRVEITPFVGYQFGGSIRVRDGYLRIKDNVNYGFALNITLRPGAQLEIMYSRQSTEMQADAFYGPKETLFDMAMEYYQIGGLYEVYRHDMFRPFGLMTLGLANFSPQTPEVASEVRFAFGLGGGVKVLPTRNFGLRLEGRLHFPFVSGGSGFWCGLPGGCAVTVGGELMVQVSLNAGLILAF
jgi:opacity protein-like surface antigen